MVVETTASTVSDAATSAIRSYGFSAGCSMEQIFSPVRITKNLSSSATPGFRAPFPAALESGPFGVNTGRFAGNSGGNEFTSYGAVGPTVAELDPYFSTIFGDNGTTFISSVDYNSVVHEPASDLNLKKTQNRSGITEVRTKGLRGPIILSSWGFDLCDKPSFGGTTFNPSTPNNRAMWQTGPVHLMWDKERQVWTGGHQMLYVQIAPEDNDNGEWGSGGQKVARVYRSSGPGGSITATGEKIIVDVGNYGLPCPIAGSVDLFAVRLNYRWYSLTDLWGGGVIIKCSYDGEWSLGQTREVRVVSMSNRLLPGPDATVRVRNELLTIGGTNTRSSTAYALFDKGGGSPGQLLSAACE